jgi:hypothetical protein
MGKKFWSLYTIIVQGEGSIRYFKIGISQDIAKRVLQIRTGCPLKIVKVLLAPGWIHKHVRRMEMAMHKRLAKYGTQGEWFRFDVDDPEHAAEFKAATREIVAPMAIAIDPTKPFRWAEWQIGEVMDICRKLQQERTAHKAEIKRRNRVRFLDNLRRAGRL